MKAILIVALASCLGAQTLPNAVPAPQAEVQYFGSDGLPLSGGKLCTYAANTSTPLATYTDSTAGTPNSNPIILDVAGRASVWVGPQLYKFVLRTGGDGTCTTGSIVWTQDNVADTTLYFVNYVKTAGTATLISYTAPFTGAVQRTVASKLADMLSVMDFGCVGDGNADDTACIQAAIDAAAVKGKGVYLPAPIDFYGTTSPLILRTNTNLQCEAYGLSVETGGGNGAPTTRIKNLSSWSKTAGDAIITNDRASDSPFSTIQNCTIEGNATTGPDYGIYFLDGNTLTLTNVLVNITKLDGIFLDRRSPSVHAAQSGTFQNVTVFSAVQDTSLAAAHGALHIEWTDVVLNAVYPTTSSEADYSEGGKRIACWIGPHGSSGAMSNSDCAHSEVGVRMEGSSWRVSNSRSDFNAGDGWQIIGSGNSFSGVQSLYDSRSAANTFDGFAVSGAGNLFTSVTETAAATAGQQRYGMYFSNVSDPPNIVYGNALIDAGGAAFTAELSTADPRHLIWDSYRRAPDAFIHNFTTGAVSVDKVSFVLLTNGTAGPYTITSLTHGFPGQRVTFLFNGDADPPTIATTANIFLDKIWTPNGLLGTTPHATLTLMTPDGTNWWEVGRTDYSVGIGNTAGIIDDLGASANNRYWDFSSNTGFLQLLGRACTDDFVTCNPWITVKRSGATISASALPERVIVGDVIGSDDSASNLQIKGLARSYGTPFGSLGASSNGSWIFCSDCAIAVAPPWTCAGGSGGAWAYRNRGIWKCPF